MRRTKTIQNHPTSLKKASSVIPKPIVEDSAEQGCEDGENLVYDASEEQLIEDGEILVRDSSKKRKVVTPSYSVPSEKNQKVSTVLKKSPNDFIPKARCSVQQMPEAEYKELLDSKVGVADIPGTVRLRADGTVYWVPLTNHAQVLECRHGKNEGRPFKTRYCAEVGNYLWEDWMDAPQLEHNKVPMPTEPWFNWICFPQKNQALSAEFVAFVNQFMNFLCEKLQKPLNPLMVTQIKEQLKEAEENIMLYEIKQQQTMSRKK